MTRRQPQPLESFAPGRQKWDIQPCHRPEEYGALLAYLRLPPPRFLTQVRFKTMAEERVLALAAAHRWLEVAAAFDEAAVRANANNSRES